MSKINRELKVLLYLNAHSDRFVTVREIADYLEISDRQARRYMEDLDLTLELDIITQKGRYGGYKLNSPLAKGFAIPENIALAMSIAMKHNDDIEQVLATLPEYITTNYIEGDNSISTDLLDKIELIIEGIKNKKIVEFKYEDYSNIFITIPYKINYTNHTYYLYCVHRHEIKAFDINKMRSIKLTGGYEPNKDISNEIDGYIKNYGVKTNKEKSVLRVKCVNQKAIETFDKYFEGKGTKDIDNLTYTVVGNSENELYYPLFRISTKCYEFIDEEFKNEYLRYLKNQIRSISDEKK